MTELKRYRYRIQFEKGEHIRFISHLDLHRTWERTLRRAALPLYHSQGYNPRPKLNLSSALPLGQTSECELLDIWLVQDIQTDQLRTRVESAVPPGLRILGITQIQHGEPSLQSSISSATYSVTLDEVVDPDVLESAVGRLLDAEHLDRVRRGKQYDLRPLIESLTIDSIDQDCVTLEMRLTSKEGASGRPDEVISALGFDPLSARIHRTGLSFLTNSA